MNFQRFLSIVKKEFIQIKRDRASLIIAVMMPIFMMVLFGYAVNTELDNISTAVLDMSSTNESRNVIKNFENTKYFKVTENAKNMEEINNDMDLGNIHAAIIIPSDYNLKLNKNEKPRLQILIDGSDPTTARTVLSSGVLTGENYSMSYINNNIQKNNQSLNAGGIDISTKVLYNPDLKNRNFTIPGLIGLVLQNITILLTAFALVKEKERGTIEQLLVSPLKSSEIILGKLIPYILIGFGDFLLSMVIGFYYFSVPIRGSMALLIFLGLGFVICSLSIGILISSAAKTQLEAMPKIIYDLGYFLPLTYFLNIVRSIVLKGMGMNYIYKDVITLFIFGGVLLSISIIQLRKNL